MSVTVWFLGLPRRKIEDMEDIEERRDREGRNARKRSLRLRGSICGLSEPGQAADAMVGGTRSAKCTSVECCRVKEGTGVGDESAEFKMETGKWREGREVK